MKEQFKSEFRESHKLGNRTLERIQNKKKQFYE